MEKVTLTLFGGVAAAVGDSAPIQFRTDKIRALLVYLMLEGDRPHQRSSLAALLWPEMPQETALKNLRQSLHRLQQALDEASPGLSAALFSVTRQTVQGNPTLADVDVLTFQALLLACERHPHRHLHLCHDCLERLDQAVALYHGELLAGFGTPDAPAFEEWLLFRREQLQQQAITALGKLAAAQAERGEGEAALTNAQRLVALDPYYEESHRLIMRLLANGGQHGRALAQYDSLARLLADELGVEPAAETTALFDEIQAAMRGETAAGHTPAALHHFPAQFTPFIGRRRELQQIEELFLDPDCRLVTLVGPGGIGKSRLSLRAGEQLAARAGFVEAITFVPLAAARSAESLLTNLLNGLGVTTAARATPYESLVNYLRRHRCLLILDNFEQLVDSAPLLGDLLAAAPGLRLLVTSQLPLQLSAEWRLPLTGLDYPAEGQPVAEPMSFSAVHLFVEAARRADPAFRLTEENEAAVLAICRLVGGLPLALELAAAWVRVMDGPAIVREISRGLDFLSLSPQDRADRHQSMAAVFAYSWALLSPSEQTVLGQLAVFRGPFSLDAATAITDATPLVLARLIDRSLVQRQQDGRYALHPLLRDFLSREAAGQDEAVARRHSDAYLDRVAAQERSLYGPQPAQAVAGLVPDLDNIRQAWGWAIAHGHWPAIERSLEGLGRFYHVAALLSEGELRFAQATAAFGDAPRLLLWHAAFLFFLGRLAEAIELAERALAESDDDATARAAAQSLLGELLPSDGRMEEAKAYQTQAIDQFQAAGDLERLAPALRRMAMASWRSGDHDGAWRYFQRAIPIHEAIEDKRGLAHIYNVLSGIYYERDDRDQALAALRQAQTLFEAIEDQQGEAIVAANMGRLYAELGQFEAALTSNQRAIDLTTELGDRRGQARDLSGRGFILAEMGDHAGSLASYFRALEIARALDDPWRMADFQASIAAVYAAQGDEATALAHYDLALPALLEQGVPYHVIGPLLGKAELLARRGQGAEARQLCAQAEALAIEADLPDFIRRSQALAASLGE